MKNELIMDLSSAAPAAAVNMSLLMPMASSRRINRPSQIKDVTERLLQVDRFVN